MTATPDMASVPHEIEQESDDDSEVYFLRPVNEYNIVDKIKEANKELFCEESVVATEVQQTRKVSFAANLEEYEPQHGINLEKLEVKLGMDFMEGGGQDLPTFKIEQKLEIIEEEETANKIETDENKFDENGERKEPSLLNVKKSETENHFIESDEDESKASAMDADLSDNLILEEICEEILLMDMDSDKLEKTDVTKSEHLTSGIIQHKMFKQITFDYTAADGDSDNQSLTNLLISDNENEPNENEVATHEYNCNESIDGEELSANADFYEDNDDDDQLSIIVASYLPGDLGSDRTSLATTVKNSPRSSKQRSVPFSKRFSLRRKTKSPNAIGSCSLHYVSNNRRFMPPPEVTDLKLHYKTCCDFKSAEQNLPNYTGYLSEYGLSREQLLERERKLQQKQEEQIDKILKTSEAERRKIHDNERAFTTWLKNKMRCPINKTRNMFDVNRPFGRRKCTSTTALNDDSKTIFNTTKYRSISAKIKKS